MRSPNVPAERRQHLKTRRLNLRERFGRDMSFIFAFASSPVYHRPVFVGRFVLPPSRFFRSAASDGCNSSVRDVTRDDGRCVTAFLPGGAGQSRGARRSRALPGPIGAPMQFNRQNIF